MKPVFDVQGKKGKSFFYDHNVLNLRRHLRSRNPVAWVLGIIIAALVIFFGVGRIFIRAEVDDFYPTTCLGTWQNAGNAAGEPETMMSANTAFSADNSAIYASGTQIFCGGFLPTDFATSGVITNVGLTLVWQIGDVPSSTTIISSATDTAIIASSTDDAATATATVTAADTSTIIIVMPSSTDPTTGSTPDPTSDPQSTSTSFLRQLIPFALADDMTSTPSTASSTMIVPPASDNNFLDVSYSTDGQTWTSIGEVNINNWQEFTATLPITDWNDLQNLQIRIEGTPTTQDPIPPIYLDGMFMEVHYETPSALPALPSLSADPPTVLLKDSSDVGVISGEQDFGSDQSPVFTVTDPNLTAGEISNLVQNNQAEIVSDPDGVLDTSAPTSSPSSDASSSDSDASSSSSSSPPDSLSSFLGILTARAAGSVDILDATVLDANGNPTDIATTIDDGQITINRTRQFKPGKYTLRVTVKTDEAIIISQQDFTWGVLAVNPDKSVYAPGDQAVVAMGVLDDAGHTICDADLTLVITDPAGVVQSFDSADGTVQQSGECAGDSKVDLPDYTTSFTIPATTGTYQIALTAVTSDGTRTIHDSFDVETSPAFDIRRIAPTRIFPDDSYPVEMAITPQADWDGTVTETVPASFQITPADQDIAYDSVHTDGDDQIISWHVHLQAGKETDLGYSFLAPPISPQFYLIGPAVLSDDSGAVAFQETREWQIASDAGACTSKTGTLNWNASSSWNSGCLGASGIPGTGDDVTISSGANITYNVTGLSIHSLTFAAGASATSLTVTSTDTMTISGTGNVLVINQPTGTATYTLAINTGTIMLANGNLSLPGTSGTASRVATVNVTGGSLTVGGSIIYGAQTIAANAVVQTTGVGTITVSSTETQAAGTLKATANGTLTFGNSFQVSSGDNATFSCAATSAVNIGGDFTAQVATTFTAGCVITFTGDATITPTAAITFSNLTISGGTVTLAGNITVAGNWTNNSGATALSAAGDSVTFTGSGKNIAGTFPTTFAGLIIATADVMNLNTSSTVTSLTFNSAATASSLTHAAGVNLTVNGNVTINQPSAAVTTSWNINAGTATVTGNINYVGANTTASRIGQVAVTTGALTVDGNITFDADTTVANQVLSYTTGVVTIDGNETVDCGTVKNITTAGTIIFNGTFSFGSASCNPVFTTISAGVIEDADDVTVANDALTYIAGSIVKYIGGSVTVTPTAAIIYGDVQILSGTVTLNGSVTVAGNWTNNSGASAFTSGGTNTITFTGSSKSIAGTFPTAFPQIVLANAAVINLNTSSTATSLTFNSGATATSLTHGTGADLTVNGDVTINQLTAAKTTGWNINAGTATVTGNINFVTASTTASEIIQVVVTTGALTVGGDVSFSANTTTADQVLSYTSGIVTINGNQTLNCGTIKNITTAGTIIFGGTFSYGDPTCNPTFTTLSGGTIEHGSDVTVSNDALTYIAGSIVQFNGTSTLTSNATTTFGDVQILDDTLTLAGNLTVAGNWTNNSGFSDAAGTVTFTGASKTIGGTLPSEFYGLVMGTGASATLATNVIVDAGGVTFNAGTAATITQNTGIDLTDSGPFTMNQPTSNSNTSAWNINAGTATVDGLITFASSATTASRIDKIALTTGTLNMNGGMTTGNGVGSSTAAIHVVDISGGAGTLNFLGTLSTNGGATLGASGWTFTNTTCTSGGGTFVYADTFAQTVYMPGSGGYCNLEIENTAGATLGAAISATNVKGNLTIGDGTTAAMFNNGGFNMVGASTATFTVANNATFQMNGTTQTFPTNFATFTFGPTGTTIYTQTSAQNISTQNYGNLTLAPAGTVTYTFLSGALGVQGNLTIGDGTDALTATASANDPTITVAGDVSITNEATFIASDLHAISIGGNWTNNGTFTANSGNVTLDTSSTAILSGSSTFYDLTVTSTVAKEIDFDPTGSFVYTVAHAFNLTGHSGNLIKLRSVSSGTQWLFRPMGTAAVTYADVQDGGCQTGAININPTNSMNSGDNDGCWFGGPPAVFALALNGSQDIILSPNATETISIVASTTDPSGPGNLLYATGTIYRTSLGNSCTANPLDCYQITSSSCVFSGSSSTVTCSADIWYYAQSAGSGQSTFPSDSWTGAITVTNGGGYTTTATSSVVNVDVLTAIGISTSTINYGNVPTNSNTESVNQSTTIQNVGNSTTTIQLSGTVLTFGPNSIATTSQHYATTSFTFGTGDQILTDTATTVSGILFPAPTSTNSATQTIYWGLGVPAGTPQGIYSGTTIFTAVLSA